MTLPEGLSFEQQIAYLAHLSNRDVFYEVRGDLVVAVVAEKYEMPVCRFVSTERI